jgi:DNA-binding transcriptional MerR regulator
MARETSGEISIGALSRRTGCNIQTIRYYEQIGLLPAPPRTEGGQRRYGDAAIQRLAFIRHARELGFDIPAIRELMELAAHPEQPCAHADRIVMEQIVAIESRIERLRALRRELKRMHEGGAHGTVSQCRVLETLADHQLCSGPHPRA